MEKYYDQKNKRLVFIKEQASADFWDKHWDFKNFKEEVKEKAKDDFVCKMTKKYLISSSRVKILEGGCGDGHFVYSLNKDGYNAYGIDYASQTIKKIKQNFPKLQVYEGDIRKIDFPKNFFDAY